MSTKEVLPNPPVKESPVNEATEPLSDVSGSERSGNEPDKVSVEEQEVSSPGADLISAEEGTVDPTDQVLEEADVSAKQADDSIEQIPDNQTHEEAEWQPSQEKAASVQQNEPPKINQEEITASEGPYADVDSTSFSEGDDPDFLVQQAASSMTTGSSEMTPGQRRKSKRNSQKFQNTVAELGHFSTARDLQGRDAEKEELAKCWSRTLRYKCQEIVIISGKPGTGKSTLVNSMRPIVSMEKPKSFFISGKFEERNHNTRGPFDVFVTAFSRYVNKLLDTDDDLLIDMVKDAMKARVKGDRKILIRAIPAMEQLLVKQQRSSMGTVSSTGSGAESGLKTQLYGSESANRLRIAFSAAVSAICSVTPILLFLDDLQWADTGSLDLLRGLMQSQDSMSLLVVACRRSSQLEEVATLGQDTLPTEKLPSDAHATSLASKEKRKAIQSILREFQNDDSVRLTHIDLNELNYESLAVLVSDVLKKKPDEVAGLSKVVFSKTQGNIFHLFQILRLLVDLGMIRREHHLWVWDQNEIERELESSRSISDLVGRTIQALPRPVQEALKTAACLGNEIDTSAIDVVLSTSTSPLLEQAANEGLLVFSAQYGGYRFAHDWIRHAAYTLIPVEERSEFHLKLGQRLWRGSSQIALDQNIMLVVSLMNFGSHLVTDKRERYKLASLNLKAGQKALKLPSFSDAAKYLKKGIELLGDDCWVGEYNLTLNLHSNTAECCCITGDYETVATSIGEVVQHANSLDDKVRAYSALLTSMEQQDDLEEATTVCADVVGKLGERLPPNPTKLTVVREFLKVRFAFRGRSDEDILSIPKMTDNRKRQCADFLSQGFIAAWRSKSPMSGMFALRSVILSLRHGIHMSSSLSFAAYASTLCGLHIDVHEGYRIGNLAIKLAERNNSPRFVSYVFLFFSAMVLHWTKPMNEVLEGLEHGKNVGMESGHVSPGCQNWLMICLGKLVTGKKLADVKAYSKGLLRQARSYRQRGTEISVSLILQLIHCYEGTAPDPSRLTGTALDYDETLQEAQETKDQVGVIQHYYFTMELCYMFGDFKEAAKMMELTLALNTGSAPTFLAASLQFMQALVAIALCRRGINSGHNKKLARKFLKDFVKWSKDAPDNYLHHRYLLEAETKALDRNNNESIMKAYNLAFVNAEKQKNLLIMALCQERVGYFLGALGEKKEALSHWTKAAGLYDAWGAFAKSKVLRDKIDNDDFEREQQIIAENTRKSCL